MFVIPSVDIIGGACVKLVQGRVGSGFAVSADPVAVAKKWEEEGARILHVVDLDGALKGTRENRRAVSRILGEVSIPVEVGGGMRSVEDVVDVIEAGARWIILGTLTVEKPDLVEEICGLIGSGKVIIALDSRGEEVVTRGWTVGHPISPIALAKEYERLKVGAYLYTPVQVEGTEGGVDVEEVRRLASLTRIPIIYAGGVSSLRDIAGLAQTGIRGVVVGSALYKGRFTLKEAEKAAEKTIG